MASLESADNDEVPASSRHTPTTTRFYGMNYIRSKITSQKNKKDTGRNQAIPEGCTNNIATSQQYVREEYGTYLCMLLLISVSMVILGSVLTLAGYYVPRLSVDELKTDNMDRKKAMETIQKHDEALTGLRIAGITLLIIGLVGICILVVIPMFCSRKSEYSLLPATEKTRASFSSTHSDMLFRYSLVKQRVQPSSLSGKRSPQKSKNDDKGFLSPDFNRGLIFVSDHNSRSIKNQITTSETDNARIRSASCDARLSPILKDLQENKSCGITGKIGNSTSDKLTVKAGSFHCLR